MPVENLRKKSWIERQYLNIKRLLKEHIRIGYIATFNINRYIGATINLGSVKLNDAVGEGKWTKDGYIQQYSEGRTYAEISVPGLGSVSSESITKDNGKSWLNNGLNPEKDVFLEAISGEGPTPEVSISVGFGVVYEYEFNK